MEKHFGKINIDNLDKTVAKRHMYILIGGLNIGCQSEYTDIITNTMTMLGR